jgi:ubiquinone/menaquinone biosynthesis C-methylase UbiE
MLEQAKSKNAGGNATWVQADVAALPHPSKQFECVICANSFHYFPHPREALREMRRVLQPGGRLVLVDWCDDYLACKICSLWLRWTDRAFQQTYSLGACEGLLRTAGFQIVDSSRFRTGWLWGLMTFVCQRSD